MKNTLVNKILMLAFMLGMMSTARAQSIEYRSSFDLSVGITAQGAYRIFDEESQAQDLIFRPDGMKMFILGSNGDEVNQYSLTNPFDITTGVTFDGSPFSVVTEDGNPTGLAFSNDGMKMFVIGFENDQINQYSLSNAYDVTSGVTNDGSPFSVAAQEIFPSDLAFSDDGMKMFVMGNTQDIEQYSLTTAFDVTSGVSHVGSSGILGSNSSFSFGDNGQKLLVVNFSGNNIRQYSLSVPYDVTSGVMLEVITDVGSEELAPIGVAFSGDGYTLFVLGQSGDDVTQYHFNPDRLIEGSDNDGFVILSATIEISGETFTNAGGSLSGSDYSIVGIPSGLSPDLAISSDGQSAALTLNGNATNHQDIHDVLDLVFTFQNNAFTGGNAAAVVNASGASSGIGIDFRNNIAAVTYGDPFDLTKIQFENTHSVSAEETEPRGLAFSADGMTMFMVGSTSNSVFQYSLTSAFNISSGVTNDGSFSVAVENTQPEAIIFNPAGTKMYIPGSLGSEINQYSLPNPFDITSGVTFDGSPLSVTAQENRVEGMTFNSDGTKMYIIGSSGDEINQYSLTTPYDLTSGVSFDGNPFSVSQALASGLAFGLDGKKLYTIGAGGDLIQEYDLLYGFDITEGVTLSGSQYSTSSEEIYPRDLVFDPSHGKIFVIGSGNDAIHQYDIRKENFVESNDNDGSISNSFPIYIVDDQFSNSGSTLTLTTDYSITGAPAGLTPLLTVAADGLSATLGFTGSVADHQFSNSTENFQVSFQNSAFVGNSVSSVVNATNASANFGFTFNDNIPAIIYEGAFDISNGAIFEGTFSIAGQSTNPASLAISPDGLKAFVVDPSSDQVEQYTLNTPSDFTDGATYDGAFPVNGQETAPSGVTFSYDGTKMFVIGSSGRDVNQYSLTTPYDITSGVSFDGNSQSIISEESFPSGVSFSREGIKMFVVGTANDNVNQYTLNTPFDVTNGITYNGSHSVASENSGATDLAFSPDGRMMFIIGATTEDAIYSYSLSIPFDITSGVTYNGSPLSITSAETAPTGFAFSPDGSKVFVTGTTGDDINQYNLELGSGSFTEASENDGAVDGTFNIQIINEKFIGAGSNMVLDTDYTLTGVPSGLTASVSIAADGQSATLSFSGNATDNQDDDDISSLVITFNNSAFESNDASIVDNSSFELTDPIDFDNNPFLTYGNGFEISYGLEYQASELLNNTLTEGYGATFNDDGTKLYFTDRRSDLVTQLSLTTPYNISGVVTSDGSRSIAAQEGNVTDVLFSADGLKMYICGFNSAQAHQYTMNTAFDITDGFTYEGSIGLGSNPTGMAFSPDGLKFSYLRGTGTIVSTQLSQPFDLLSDRNTLGSTTISANTPNPWGMEMSVDGYKMFIIDESTDAIHQYTLSQAFNVSSATFDTSETLPFLPGGIPFGLAMNPEGNQFYTIDFNEKRIRQYNISRDGFFETANNDGALDGYASVSLTGGTFSNAGNSLVFNTDYSLSSVPTGLTPILSINTSGNVATLTFSGNAANHADINDIADLEITFTSSAFSGNDLSGLSNPSGSLGVAIDFRDNNPMITYGNGFDVLSATLKNSFSTDGEEASPTGMSFNGDGSKLYLVGFSQAAVFQYSLSEAYEVSSATYDNISFDVSSEGTDHRGITFNSDGTKMYLAGTSSGLINQYSLSSPFDLSAGVTLDLSFAPESSAFPLNLSFNHDGTIVYFTETQDDQIHQYSVGNPFDLSGSVTFMSLLNISNYDGAPGAVRISPNGKKLVMAGISNTKLSLFELAIPDDISTATFVGQLDVRNLDLSLQDVAFNATGSRMFTIGGVNSKIFQYDIELGSFREASENDGSVDETIDIPLSLVDEKFTNPSGQLAYNEDYTINNLPAGLNALLSVDASATEATLSFSGQAIDHQGINDVESLEFTFNNTAFASNNAVQVAGAIESSSLLSVDFRDNNPTLTYGDGYNLAVASYSGNSLDISARDTYINGVAFNSDGTKLFTSGNSSNEIFEYNLPEPYNLSGAVDSGNSLDISVNASGPQDIYFSQDGTKLFVLSNSNYEVVQYNLTTAFDLSSATYSGNSFSVEAQDDSPYGLTFSTDGSKMYVAGSDSYAVNQYDLSTSFDASTASFSFAFSVENDEESPSGIVFSLDGWYLIVVGDSDNEAIRYTLNVPFDLSMGANLDAAFLDLSNEDPYPTGVTFSGDGSKLLISGSDNNTIYQYNLAIGGFTETIANDGTVEGSTTIRILDDSFTKAGGTLVFGGGFDADYGINNLPAGFTPTLTVAADGYSASLTLTGSPASHGDADDISSLQFIFRSSAFTEYDVNEVENTINHHSGFGIDYLPYTENAITDFTFAGINGSATITSASHTIVAEAVAGTDISVLSPTLTISKAASAAPDSGTEQDFTTTVTYTVTAEDGSPQDWDVTITEALATPTDIQLSGTSVDENLTPNAFVGTFSTVDVSFSDSFTYQFTSGDGSDDNTSFGITDDQLTLTPTADFETKDTYNIRVKTDDNNGGTFEKAFVITINDINEAPTDILLSSSSTDESNPAGTFVGTLSTPDEDAGEIHTYSLKAGNSDNDSFSINGSDLVTDQELDFETKSIYNLEIIVTDQGGLTFEQEFAISVNDLPAQITSIEIDNSSINENEPSSSSIGTFSTFGEDLTGSFTYSLVTGAGSDDNASFTISGDQLLSNASFNFESKSSYSILVMTDDGNQSDEKVFIISVDDVVENPTNILLSANAIQENNAVTDPIGSLSTTDEDAGETHTYALVSGAGDDDNGSFAIIDDVLQATQVFDFEAQSSYSIRVESSDGNGGSYQQVLAITITNANESILIINPIADQQLDERFASLEIDFSNVFADEDGDALTFEVASSDVNVVTVSSLGAILTITEGSAFGTSTITVSASDGSGIITSDEFIVTVVNVNDAPIVANAISDQNLDEGFATIELDLSTTFSDEDGDALVLSAVSGDENVVTISETGSVLTVTEIGNGSTTITVTAADGNGGTVSDEFTVIVNNVNDAPIVVNPIGDKFREEGAPQSQFSYADTFSDPDGDELTVTVSSSDESVVSMEVVSNQQVTVTIVGVGLSTITLTADDGNGGTVSDTFTYTVTEKVNSAPIVVNSYADGFISEEGFTASQVSYAGVFSDPDGDDLTVSVSSSDESVVTVEVILNEQMQINEVGIGTSTITVTADDGNGGAVSDTFTYTVTEKVNNAPIVVNSYADGFISEEGFTASQVSYADVFSDPDGDDLTVSVSSSDESVVTVEVILNEQMQINEVGVGTSTITVTADDGNGGTVSDTFTYTVNEVLEVGTDITAFSLTEQTVPATIDFDNHTVEIEVVFATDVTSLTPIIEISSEASITPSGPQDFTNAVTYTVIAEDQTTMQDWTVTVTEALSNETDILELSDPDQKEAATIDAVNHTVFIVIQPSSDVISFRPTLVLSEGATYTSTEFGNLEQPITFTVTAADGITTQDWIVTVTVDLTGTNGLEDEIEATVYPNPAVDFLKIKSNSELEVKLTTSDGRVLLKTNGADLSLDLRLLGSGMYILILSDGNSISYKRIVKAN